MSRTFVGAWRGMVVAAVSLALASGCASSSEEVQHDPLEDAPDLLVANDTAGFAVALTATQLDRLLKDSAAWGRMKHPNGSLVFRAVTIATKTSGAVITAEAIDYDSSPTKTIPMNFELQNAANGTRTLLLKSTVYYLGVPVIRSDKLTLKMVRTATQLNMTVDAIPTWAARTFGGDQIKTVTVQLRNLFGNWAKLEGPKQPK